MIQKFLKAKHWQIFLLTIGIPMVFQYLLIGAAISDPEASPASIANLIVFVPILVLVVLFGLFGLFGWFWSIGIGLQSKIPQNVKMNVNRFKIFFFIPLIYLLLLTGFVVFFINGEKPDVTMFMTIFPIHLFSMFCILHTMYFIAKTIKTVELQREAEFSDFVGEFFLFWFYPFGMWILQPKINRIVEE
jgi:hypothetical protein